jgi:hypothetical protein
VAEINQDIEIWAGEDVIIYVDMGNIDLDAINEIRWHLSETSDADVVEVEKSLNNGILAYPITNRIKIELDSIDTIDLGGNRYFQEIRIWDNVGNQSTVMTGRIKINSTTHIQSQGS